MNNIDFKYLFTTAEGRISRQQWWIGVGILPGTVGPNEYGADPLGA